MIDNRLHKGLWSTLHHGVTPQTIGCGVFLYVMAMGLLLQKVILPLTPWHAGHGLLAGGDWVRFHSIADRLAQTIEGQGWNHWVLRPEGQAPSGVAAALYVLTGIHEPWVVLPVNATLYAMAATCLWHAVFLISRSRNTALFVLVPMMLFPSTAMIWGQIHKDVWVLAGVLGLVRGFVNLDRTRSMRDGLRLACLTSLSTGLIWIMRPYAAKIFLAASVLAVLVLAVLDRPRHRAWWGAAGLFLLIQAIVVVQAPVEASAQVCDVWYQQPPIPVLDRQLASLACTREAFRVSYPLAGSNIDVDVAFHHVRDLVRYLPRALQIALFAPFPTMWVEVTHAVQPGGGVQRLLVIPEMVVYYLALVGCVGFLVPAGGQRQAILVALFGFAVVIAWIYALVVTNVGTLYRMRYPAMLLLCAIGGWGWTRLWAKRTRFFPPAPRPSESHRAQAPVRRH